MAALNDAGVRPAFIAAYTGRTANGVTGWLKRNGSYTSRRMTADECAEIERLYYEGCSIEQVAEAVGRTHGGVRYYLKQQDLFRPERTHVTPAMSDKMKVWYDRGVPIANIGARLGVSEATIYNHIKPERRTRITADDKHHIIARYETGGYVSDIARAMGRDHSTVRNVLKQAGIYSPGRSPQRKGGWHHHEDRIFGGRKTRQGEIK